MNRNSSTFLILSLILITFTVSQLTQALANVSINLSCSNIEYIEGCAQYHTDGSCHQCQYGYALSNYQCVLTNTTADCCSSYNTDGSCVTCNTGLFSNDPYCMRNNIHGCAQKQQDKCLVCAKGYRLQNNKCLPNIKNCIYYSNNGQCSACLKGYKLINSLCQESSQVNNCKITNRLGCVECQSGYYLTCKRTCNPFEPGCLNYWQEKCQVCAFPFQLINGSCKISGCQTYSSSGCTACQNPYTVDSKGRCSFNNCLNVVNGNCVECADDYRLTANGCIKPTAFQCQACRIGFTFVNNACVKIINGCVTYASSGLTCVACMSNFQLTVNGVCQIYGCNQYNNNGCTNCSSPFTLVNNGCIISNCIQYSPDGCLSCNNNTILLGLVCVQKNPLCLTYNSGVCSSCVNGYYLLNNNCIKKQRGCSYNNNGVCSCITPFLSNNGQCQILGCNSYDSNDRCIECVANFILNSTSFQCYVNNCAEYTFRSCKTCVQGYVISNGLCVVSDIYCQKYQNGVCAQCLNGYVLDSNGHCLKQIAHCIAIGNDRISCIKCEDGYILSNSCCKKALSNCKTQTSDTNLCILCFDGFHLVQGLCVLNDANCQTYSLKDLSENCSQCKAGYVLAGYQCVKQLPGCIYNGSVCISCISPFLYNANNQSCYISGCSSYNNSGCLSCMSPFQLSGKQCVIDNCKEYSSTCCIACKFGYTLSNGLCVSTDPNCVAFSTDCCLQCRTGYSLQQKKCVLTDQNCLQYNNNGVCSKCKDNYYINLNSRCQIQQNGCIYQGGICKFCTLPFEMNPSTNICQVDNCLQTNKNGCLKCRQPFTLDTTSFECLIKNCQRYQGSLCAVCNSNYHLKEGVTCVPNDPNCLSYDQDGNCQLCSNSTILMSSGECQTAKSTCLETCSSDISKCLKCQQGYFLNRFFQCQKLDQNCFEYTNGVCSLCSNTTFLYNGICFPYTPGCVSYEGKNCIQCKRNYVLKNFECFAWNATGLQLEGGNDKYDFQINPIDVRKSKYYIDNLSPASQIGAAFFSSKFSEKYNNFCISSDQIVTSGWKALTSDQNQFIGYTVTGSPVSFYAVQLEAVEGNYIKQFYLEYSVDGINFIKVSNIYTVPNTIVSDLVTIYFTGIYAQAIRIRINSYFGWPACRIDFFYYDILRFRKISNLKSLKYLENTIDSNFVDRVDNQIYINQVYFFNPAAACTSKELCFTGLQLCQSRNITSLTLNFDNPTSSVTQFYLTYSVDGRNYNCYQSCVKFTVNNITNNQFNFKFDNLIAQSVRIYPTKFIGTPKFSPAFYYC